MGLSSIGRRLDVGSPLMEGMVRFGRVELRPGLVVECGRTFIWWRRSDRSPRELMRVVAASVENGFPARVVVLAGGDHEMIVFSDEIELWKPPARRSPYAAVRLRQLVGEPRS